MWNQVYNPFSSEVLSTLVAALPVATLLAAPLWLIIRGLYKPLDRLGRVRILPYADYFLYFSHLGFRTFWGTVSQVREAPITVQNVVTYDVVVSVDNPDFALLPGMTANTRITRWRGRRVPSSHTGTVERATCSCAT